MAININNRFRSSPRIGVLPPANFRETQYVFAGVASPRGMHLKVANDKGSLLTVLANLLQVSGALRNTLGPLQPTANVGNSTNYFLNHSAFLHLLLFSYFPHQ